MAKSSEPAHWHEVAELMAREGLSFREAATKLGLALTSEQASNEFRAKPFQRLLRAARFRFYREIASDPEWAKKTAIGMMLYSAERLMEEGQFDKVMDGLLKAAKIEGWLTEGTEINIFGGLNQSELDRVREQIRQRLAERVA